MMKRMRHGGFSLLELSVVLAIVALVVTFGMDIARNALRGSDILSTREKLQVIKRALDDYASRYGYLPCPAPLNATPNDAAFGISVGLVGGPPVNGCDSTPGIGVATLNAPAVGYIGMIPVRSLNLPDSYAADAWSNKINYAVSRAHVATVQGYAGSNGNLTVYRGILGGGPITLTTRDDGTLGQAATYVAFSSGPTGFGAYPLYSTAIAAACSTTYTTDAGNCDYNLGVAGAKDQEFYDNEYNDSRIATTFFDDFVVWGTNAAERSSSSAAIAASSSGCSSGCETWCATCSMNMGAPTTPVDARQKLCDKWITSTSPCRATCYWAGYDSATTRYTACP